MDRDSYNKIAYVQDLGIHLIKSITIGRPEGKEETGRMAEFDTDAETWDAERLRLHAELHKPRLHVDYSSLIGTSSANGELQ